MGKVIKNVCKATHRKPSTVRESQILCQSSFLDLRILGSSVTTYMLYTWLCITLCLIHIIVAIISIIMLLPLATIVKFHSSIQSYYFIVAVDGEKLLRWPTTIERCFQQKKPNRKSSAGRTGLFYCKPVGLGSLEAICSLTK